MFRKVLQSAGEERLVLRKDVHEACLVLYPETVWNEQMDIMRSRLNRWNRHEQQVFRQFVIDAAEVTTLTAASSSHSVSKICSAWLSRYAS